MTAEEENKILKTALAEIASYQVAGEFEEDEDGFTEWGVEKAEATEMAYENVICVAQSALRRIQQ